MLRKTGTEEWDSVAAVDDVVMTYGGDKTASAEVEDKRIGSVAEGEAMGEKSTPVFCPECGIKSRGTLMKDPCTRCGKIGFNVCAQHANYYGEDEIVGYTMEEEQGRFDDIWCCRCVARAEAQAYRDIDERYAKRKRTEEGDA